MTPGSGVRAVLGRGGVTSRFWPHSSQGLPGGLRIRNLRPAWQVPVTRQPELLSQSPTDRVAAKPQKGISQSPGRRKSEVGVRARVGLRESLQTASLSLYRSVTVSQLQALC